MDRIRFEVQGPVTPSDPNRADIALFVGFVDRRATPVPAGLTQWLRERGWSTDRSGGESEETLLDVPVPIDTWELFDHLFAWDERRLGVEEGPTGATYLGTAVRSFFAQGGQRCYVVPAGGSFALRTSHAEREGLLPFLIPGFPIRVASSPEDRRSWRGVGHVFGLPDVSFVCLPDLPDLVRTEDVELETGQEPVGMTERFVECSAREEEPSADRSTFGINAPRCDDGGYVRWAQAVRLVTMMLRRHAREAQLVASIPLPAGDSRAEAGLVQFMVAQGWLSPLGEAGAGLGSSFVQLAYPWVQTPAAARLPGRIEGPDGVVVGVLARNALGRGAFRSAASLHLTDVYGVMPALRRDDVTRPGTERTGTAPSAPALIDRVSLLGREPEGLRLLSDVTMSHDPTYRPASVHRLVSVIVRAARRLGEDAVFEASGEQLWNRLRERLENLLRRLWERGVIGGKTAADAFEVRCDRSTMSQNDIDAGRAIARVRFVAASPVEEITVLLTVVEGGAQSPPSSAGAVEDAA